MLYFWNVLITTRVKGTSRGEAPKLNAPYLKRETNEYCEAKKKKDTFFLKVCSDWTWNTQLVRAFLLVFNVVERKESLLPSQTWHFRI